MAFSFIPKKTATLTATLSGTSKKINIPGCNPDEPSGDNAAAQVNKILSIGGKAIVADDKMVLDTKKGVAEDD